MSWKWFAKLAISLGLLSWLLWRSDRAAIASALSNISIGAALTLLAVFVAAVAVGAMRWRLFLPGFAFRRLFALSFIGIFYSVVLPGQLAGEAMKAYRLGKGNRLAERIAASVLVDKVNGVVALLFLGLIGVAVSRVHISPVVTVTMVGITFVVVLGLTVSGLPMGHRLLNRLRVVVGPGRPRLQNLFERLGLFLGAWREFVRNAKVMAVSLTLGCLYQLLCIAIIVIAARRLGVEVAPINWLWINTIVSLALLLPLSIGGIGLREGAFVGVLTLLSVPAERALALSLTVFATQLFAALIGGTLEILEGRTRRAPTGDL